MYKDFISKFSKLVENVTARSSNAGFLIGDQVKFTKKAAKSPWFNNMNEIYLRDLAEFMACEVPMRIAAIRSDSTPAAFGFATGQDNVGAERFADVYMEIAPGRQGRIITVPCSVLEEKLFVVNVEHKRPRAGACQDARVAAVGILGGVERPPRDARRLPALRTLHRYFPGQRH